jgi:hypothetical protein
MNYNVIHVFCTQSNQYRPVNLILYVMRRRGEMRRKLVPGDSEQYLLLTLSGSVGRINPELFSNKMGHEHVYATGQGDVM